MIDAANPINRRIGQLIRMLSSDHAGEAAAAAQALTRALAEAGSDLHELAKIAEAGLRMPVPTEQPRRLSPAAKTKDRGPCGRPLAMGQRLVCDQPSGVFRACDCGGILFTVKAAIGVMPSGERIIGQLVCDACGCGGLLVCNACRRGGRWLSRAHFGATS
jgi:hypothetical protein